MKMAEQPAKKEVKIAFPEALRGGAYANSMFVTHTKEEFILDFMMITPPVGTVTARVITSPGHMKRMVSVLTENLKKYEARFGKLTEAPEPPRPAMGFHPPE
jgi:hypothetical protein